MSQRDIYHDAVKTALEQGNWSRPEIEFHKLPQAHAHLSWAKAGTFKPLDLFQKFVSLAFDFYIPFDVLKSIVWKHEAFYSSSRFFC